MKLTRGRPASALGFNMTPMIDIVFLLIIFFMTVSQITRVSQQAIQLPTVTQAADSSEVTTLLVVVDEMGTLFLRGETCSLDQLISEIQKVKERGERQSLVQLFLRCDRRCKSEHVNRLMKRLSEVGVHTIQTSVLED